MPFAEVNLVPSVNVETSPADNPAGVQQSNFIRWRANLPEKRGGCTLYINNPVNGAPVALKPWGDFQGNSYLGIATPQQIYQYNPDTATLRDISPTSFTSSNATPTFTTTAGSSDVNITDATEPGLSQFDAVRFNTPVAIGGLILNGTYPLKSGAIAHQYTINAGYDATSSVTSSGQLPVFEAQSGSSQIKVAFPIQYQFDSLATGDRIGFTVQTVVGGIPVLGAYVVSEVLDATDYTFQAQYTAPYSQIATMNNGFVSLTYWITQPPGPPPP